MREQTGTMTGRLVLVCALALVFVLSLTVSAYAATPTAPGFFDAYPAGSGQVRLEWMRSTDATVTHTPTYEVYRSKYPISPANLATGLGNGSIAIIPPVADPSGTTTMTALFNAAADEITQSYVWFYAIRAKDNDNVWSELSATLAPNMHGYRSDPNMLSCQRCHNVHGAPVPPGIVDRSSWICYYCHGTTTSTASGNDGTAAGDLGDRSTLHVKKDFYDYGNLPAGGSQHRGDLMTETQCKACHTPHRTPYFNDLAGAYQEASSYRKMLRVQTGVNASTGKPTYTNGYYSLNSDGAENTSFCFSCHGSTTASPTDGSAQTNMGYVSTNGYAATAGDHNEAGYAAAAHGGGVIKSNDWGRTAEGEYPQVQCLACHAKHASAADKLIAYRGDDTDGAGTFAQAELCYECHSAGSTEAKVAAGYSAPFSWNGRDVKAQFAKVSRHPTSVPTGAPVASAGTWSQTAQGEFALDALTDTVATSGGSVELQTLSGGPLYFSDGFESNSMAAWDSDPTYWEPTAADKRTGSYAARGFTDTGGTRRTDYLLKTIGVSSRTNVVLNYAYRTQGFAGGTDYFRAEYSTNGGGAWTQLFNTTANAAWTTRADPIPSNANLVRFTSSVNGTTEFCYLDDVSITSDPLPYVYENNGAVVSIPIASAGSLEAWGTLTYGETQPGGTSHTVDVLDGSGNVLASDVASGANLAGLGVTASTIKLRANLTGNGTVARVASDDFNDNSFDAAKWNDVFLNSTDPDAVAVDALNEDFTTASWPTNLPTQTGLWQRNASWSNPAGSYSIRGGNGDIQPGGFSDDFEDGANLTGWATSGAGTWASAQTWSSPNWSMQNTRAGAGTSVASASFTPLASQGTFTFDWRAVALDNNDSMSADYTINGADWFNVWTRVGDGTTAEGNAAVLIPAGTTQIRFQFVLGGYTAGEMAYWDNVILGADPTLKFGDDIQDGSISDWSLSQATRFVDTFSDSDISDWTLSGGAILADNFADNDITDWTTSGGYVLFDDFEDGNYTASPVWAPTGTWTTTQNWNNPNWSVQGSQNGTNCSLTATIAALAADTPLTLDWQRVGLDTGETMRVGYSTDGTNYTYLDISDTNNGTTTTSGTSTVTIPTGAVRIRLRVLSVNDAANEYARFDNVRLGTLEWATDSTWVGAPPSIKGQTATAPIVLNEGTTTGWTATTGTWNASASWGNPQPSVQGQRTTTSGAELRSPTFTALAAATPLTFDWQSVLNAGEIMNVAYNIGGTWTTCWTYTSTGATPASGSAGVTIPASATQIRLMVTQVSDNTQWGRWDNIRLGGAAVALSPAFTGLAADTPLSFDWQRVLLDAGETMYVDALSGTTWTNVWTVASDGSTTSGNASVTVPAGAIRLRLRVLTGDGSTESGRWDNIYLGTPPHWTATGGLIQGQSMSGDATALSPTFTALPSDGTLTFDWQAELLEAGENMYVDLYYASAWHEVWNWTTGAGGGTGVSVVAPTGTSQVRLRATAVNVADEYARWDNIQITSPQWRTTAAWGNPQPSIQGQSMSGDAIAVSPTFTALPSAGTLTFDWQAELLEAGENMYVDLYYASAWHEVWSRTTGTGSGTGVSVVAPVGTSQVRLRAAAVNVADEYARWDNIVIRTEPSDDVLVSKVMDLTGWTNVALAFAWQKTLLDTDEYMYCEYSTNGGGSWNALWSQAGTGGTVAGTSGSLSVPSTTATTLVRFRVTGAECGEYGYFDQIVVSGNAPAMWPKETSQKLTLRAEGAGFTGTADQGEFTYIDPANATWISAANFDLRVNLAEVRSNAPQAGLMIRTGTTEANAYANNATFVGLWPTGGTTANFAYRNGAGAAAAVNGTAATTLPEWLRITRTGNAFAAYISGDGSTWTQVGTNQTVTMSTFVLVGLGTTSATDGVFSEADYDNFSVTETGMTSTATPALNDWAVGYTYFPATATGKLTCANCHNAHSVVTGNTNEATPANWWNMSRVSDPDNTNTNYAGTATAFCLECHDYSDTPIAAVINATTLVPYRPEFSAQTAPYFPGWNKAAAGLAFTTSGHYTTTGQKALCKNCHDPHASDFQRLVAWTAPTGAEIVGGWTPTAGLRANSTASLSQEENLCYQCHGNGTIGKQATGAANVATPATPGGATTNNKHVMSSYTGRHSDAEAAADLGATTRHSECADCHDAHAAKKVGGTATQDTVDTSAPGGAVYGAWGVAPDYASATRTGSNPGGMGTFNWGIPTGYTPLRLSGASGDFEAYLCFKCHSGNTTQPGTQSNAALEFNPSNASVHNVLGQSVGMQSAFTVTGSDGTTGSYSWPVPTRGVFRAGTSMGPSTMLTCTSCHTNESGQAKGPHGSTVRWLIDPAYPTDWKTVALSDGAANGIGNLTGGAQNTTNICAKCHDLKAGGGWSNNAHGYGSNDHGYGRNASCNACHIAIPHGWKRPRLLGYTSNPATGSGTATDGVYKTTDLNGISPNPGLSLDGNGQVTGWSASDCAQVGCTQHSSTISPYWP